MPSEAPLEKAGEGLAPKGEGWFVLNARQARWRDGDFGKYTRFQGDAGFDQLGINVGILQPGQASCMYHGEDAQEDFLVLSGECLVLIEGQERRLKAWDFVHCPPMAEHVFVGAGDGPAVLLAVGRRGPDEDIIYRESELAQRHGAGVAKTTKDPDEAYAGNNPDVDVPYGEGWLPG